MKDKLYTVRFPVDTIIHNHVKNYAECNYELYLIELLNKSEAMRRLADNEEYILIKNQSNGECDCKAGKYKLDFKLLESTTQCEALSGTSHKEEYFEGGIYFSTPPRPDVKFKVVILWRALMQYDENALKRIVTGNLPEKSSEEYIIERDVNRFLNNIKKPKNLFMLFPYELFFNQDVDNEAGIEFIKQSFLDMLGPSFRITHERNEFDTFIVFVYQKEFWIFKYFDDQFCVFDRVSIFDIKKFGDLVVIGMSSFQNRNYLRTFESMEEFDKAKKEIVDSYNVNINNKDTLNKVYEEIGENKGEDMFV